MPPVADGWVAKPCRLVDVDGMDGRDGMAVSRTPDRADGAVGQEVSAARLACTSENVAQMPHMVQTASAADTRSL